MKKESVLIITMSIASSLMAQTKKWVSPHVGYSNTTALKIEKIAFAPKKTIVYASATAPSGNKIILSPKAALVANGTRYQITKATRGLLNKPYAMPDSGIVHFEMTFPPLPTDTHLLHFTEDKEDDNSWRLCNIKEHKANTTSAMPSEWTDVTYTDIDSLPQSAFCDDSTRIHVTILNYTPEAATDIRLSYPMVDMGTTAYNKRFPISESGKAVISIHPCFPLTVYMQLGSSSKAPILIEPGKDADILLDMDNATTDFPAVGFKGTLAPINYEMNAKGGKDKIVYNNSHAYYDSLYSSSTYLNNIINDVHFNIQESCQSMSYTPATQLYLDLTNSYRLCEHSFFLNDYIASKTTGIVKGSTTNPSILRAISNCEFIPGTYIYEQNLLASDQLTLCPYFTTAMKFRSMPEEKRFVKQTGETNTYNKDIYLLNEALGYINAGYNEEAERFHRQITDSTLKAYYTTAAERWEHRLAQMNEATNVHMCKNINLRGNALREKILNEHKGKTVTFVAFNKGQANSQTQIRHIYDVIAKCDKAKNAFVMIDFDIDQDNYDTWYRMACQHTGEYYMDMNQSYFSLFNGAYSSFTQGCLFMVYDANGTCLLSASNIEELEKITNRLNPLKRE